MLEHGEGDLLSTITADEIRDWNREHKSRGLVEKVTTARSAVEKYVKEPSKPALE